MWYDTWVKEVIDAFLSHDIKTFIESIGIFGIWAVVFAESGLLVGFFLPGDSLLFTAGFLASPVNGWFSIWPLVLGSWVAAIVGDNVGYEFGKRVGPRLFSREKSLLFNPEHVAKAQAFYEKHGGIAITLARFVPVVRTFVPVVAGIGKMEHKSFTYYNFLGGTVWVWLMTWGGYFLGKIPGVEKHLELIIISIIIASVLPPIWHLYKERKEASKVDTIQK